ncbi:DUF2513 domain-containing protein [Methylobacterium sp. Leaf465]|uniref:DUF2513 domain-containing protein n=1 Tax=Methylobacterium sp. Leaf465 TaxID=1736385 RepID=UPI0009E8DDBA|nr:DUF2513 domain-containing protein [Methylobacterium sp. Leaf465]
MKRDMELVREILLAIEGGLKQMDLTEGLPGSQFTPEQFEYHYSLMVEHGLIDQMARSLGGGVYVRGMTWEGHDFIDTLRDPEIWKKTKSAASTIGGVGFKATVEIGKAIAKQKLQELGIPIP